MFYSFSLFNECSVLHVMLGLVFLAQSAVCTLPEVPTGLVFSHNSFKLVRPVQGDRVARQFSFFTDPAENESEDHSKPEFSDPAEYYAKVQRKS